MQDIIVVGGGAAGMVAAIVAARNGANVLILERLSRVGKKLLVTGNGRCNLTNIHLDEERYHTSSKVDHLNPLQQIGYEETINFFEELGIVPLIEEHKVYPASEQASSVLDVLRMALEKCNVTLCMDTKVIEIIKKDKKWQVKSEEGTTYSAENIIFATGGLAGPSFGCDETGYNVLKKVGHTIIPAFPTLVHIVSPSPYSKMMKGAKIKCEASIWVNDKVKRKEYGEVLFTEDGLSGPPIFQLSRLAAEAKAKRQKAKVCLDLLPTQTKDEVIGMIYSRIALGEGRTIEELFIGWIHKRIAMPLIKYANIGSMNAPCENLEYEMIERLAESIKNFEFEAAGTRGYKYAQATAGGISLDEIDLKTMASKKAKGLYLTGELIDVDGDCGGFNLQWAWSTGYIAGLSASQKK